MTTTSSKIYKVGSLEKVILKKIKSLTKTYQAEVLDFVEYLSSKKRKTKSADEKRWNEMSLNSVVKDIENDPVEYTTKDIKEIFS